MAAAPFVILALPRSRTAWLSAWLTHGGRYCHHDALAFVHGGAALQALVQGGNGIAETAGHALPRVLHALLPDARFLVIHRDPAQIIHSLGMLGAWNARSIVEAGRRALDDAVGYLKPRARVMEAGYSDLSKAHALRSIWGFLRDDAHDDARTKALVGMRITKLDPFAGMPPTELLAEEQRLREAGP